jgi:proteasome assembly chaperone (PAC2) family protein
MTSNIGKNLNLRNATMIAAWPGMGHVGVGAVGYLKEMLGAEEVGGLELPELFDLPGVFVEKGLAQLPRFPESKFYVWRNGQADNDLVFFLGESQPSRKGYDYAARVLDIAEELEVKRIYTCAAAPAAIRHRQRPRILAVANDRELLGFLRKHQVILMGDGSISGMNGLLLGVAAERNIEAVCLLGQLPYYTVTIPNPRSSKAVLDVLCKMIEVDVDMGNMDVIIKDSDDEIEQLVKSSEQMEEMMGNMASESQQSTSEGSEKVSTIEDEIRIRRRIEKLFKQTEQDKSQVSELKTELDKWDLFKEYEDRFLSLFKKGNQ